jgi:hypothetical protein
VSRLLILLSFIVVGLCSIILAWTQSRYFFFWLPVIILIYAILYFGHDRITRSEYRKIHDDYGVLARRYRRSYAFIRFCMFARDLAKNRITHDQASDVESLLNLEDKTSLSFFANNLFTVSIVGLLTAIAAGAASIETAWKSGLMPVVLALILSVLYVHFLIYPFTSPQTKRSELRRFLYWYRCAPENTWIKTYRENPTD